MAAAQAANDKGYKNLDGTLPYPVHGFHHNLGIKRSWIGRVVLAALLTGAFCGFMMQWWMMKENWPVIISGKPYNSWPAFVVITFECGILSGALTNMFCVLIAACKLYPQPDTFVLRRDLTDDTFCLAIPLDGNGTEGDLQSFLVEQGAADITAFDPPAPAAVSDEEGETAMLKLVSGLTAVALGAAVLGGCVEQPPDQSFDGRGLRYMPDMYQSQALESHESYAVIDEVEVTQEDGTIAIEKRITMVPAMMEPPKGTAARDFIAYPVGDPLDPEALAAANALINPVQPTSDVLARGQDRYDVFCAPCHGRSGNIKDAYVPQVNGVLSIDTDNVAQKTDGELYHIISLGRNRMPNYRAQLMPEDRWAVVHYMRKLYAAKQLSGPEKVRLEQVEQSGAAARFEGLPESPVQYDPTHRPYLPREDAE